MLNAPRAAARAAEIDDPLIRRCGLASQIAASSLVAIMAMVPLVFYHDEIPAFAIAWLPFLGIALFLTIGGLTVIESIGIRFFGRQRGWRITHDVAWTVCSLASIGWFIGACVCALGIALIHLGGMQHQRLIDSRHLPDFIDVGAIVAIAGALIGLLYFELLVYLGIRQCRFANPPGVRRYSAAGGSSGPVRIQRADSQQ
jgi:hypothetical protein